MRGGWNPESGRVPMAQEAPRCVTRDNFGDKLAPLRSLLRIRQRPARYRLTTFPGAGDEAVRQRAVLLPGDDDRRAITRCPPLKIQQTELPVAGARIVIGQHATEHLPMGREKEPILLPPALAFDSTMWESRATGIAISSTSNPQRDGQIASKSNPLITSDRSTSVPIPSPARVSARRSTTARASSVSLGSSSGSVPANSSNPWSRHTCQAASRFPASAGRAFCGRRIRSDA